MNAKSKLNQRTQLAEIVTNSDERDCTQLLAFAAGYEAGKIDHQIRNQQEQSSTQQAS